MTEGVCLCRGRIKKTTFGEVWAKRGSKPNEKEFSDNDECMVCENCGLTYAIASVTVDSDDIEILETPNGKGFGYSNGRKE
ncbi:MAG: hypothetical protein ACXABY_06195 [Candidatus Thorarchaeota archaeon]|jgi:hypothetical protein